MIVSCGPGQTIPCFERGVEAGVDTAGSGVQAPPAPRTVAEPVEFGLWYGRNDAVAELGAALAHTTGAGRAPGRRVVRGPTERGRTVNMRTGSSSNDRGAYTVPPNPFTRCLYREMDLWSRISAAGGLTGLCCPTTPKDRPPPWVTMPGEGRRFQQIGSIVLPLVEGVDSLVTTFQVPTGYDGVIVSIVNMFTGTGFVEGSGDLHYRIQINRRWLKDYGDIQTTMGTVASPCMIYRGGVRLKTQEVVSYWVQLGAGALGRLIPGGRIVCAFFGWFYPQV